MNLRNVQTQSKKIKDLIASGDFKNAKDEFIVFSEWTDNSDIKNASYLIASQFSFLSKEITNNLRETDTFYQKVIYAILEQTDKISINLQSSQTINTDSKLSSGFDDKLKIPNNLPSPFYNEFISRPKIFEKIFEGIKSRYSITQIVSLGGNGKTSVIYEFCSNVLKKEIELPFDAIVWVSDYEKRHTTDLDTILDEICITLKVSDYTKLALDEKISYSNDLLKNQSILLIIDNFETIKCEKLNKWLTTITENTKVLITSRELIENIKNRSMVVLIEGFEYHEAENYILKKSKDLGINGVSQEMLFQFKPLIECTGGNPKALEVALGYIKYDHKPLDMVISTISNAKGEIFNILFHDSWESLNEDEKNILLTMGLFPTGGYAFMISYVSSVKNGYFDNAMKRLNDLSLVSVVHQDVLSNPFYFLHPLVQSFIKTKNSDNNKSDLDMRERWLDGYINFAENIGFCWNDIKRLKELDVPNMKEGIEYAINWAYQNGKFEEVIKLTNDIKYYYYVRGFWATENNLLRAKAANKIRNYSAEFEALTYHINIASKQDNLAEVAKHLSRLDEIIELERNLPSEHLVNYNHSKALYLSAQNKHQEAQNLWKENLKNTKISAHDSNANRRHLAISLFKSGNLVESRELLNFVIEESKSNNFLKGELSARIFLAKIDFEEGNFRALLDSLNEALEIANSIEELSAIADIEFMIGLYHGKTENYQLAKAFVEKSLKRYEKLNNQNKISEAKEALRGIDHKNLTRLSN